MLELRPNCELCNRDLPPNSMAAMICSFECTFCKSCVEKLQNVCPNCGGGFQPRPVRPSPMLEKFPISDKRILKPLSKKHGRYLKQYDDIAPEDR